MEKRERVGNSRVDTREMFQKLGYIPVCSDAGMEEKLGLLLREDFYSAVQTVHDLLRRGIVTYDDVLPFFR